MRNLGKNHGHYDILNKRVFIEELKKNYGDFKNYIPLIQKAI